MGNLTDVKRERVDVQDASGKHLILHVLVNRIGFDTQDGVIWQETTATYALEDGRDVTPADGGTYKVSATGEVLTVIK